MKKKLTIILLSMVVAVTMLAPLQAFAQDTAAVAGQQSEQADSQEETSAPAQTQETAQKYTVKFRAADARGHLLKGAAFRVSAQNGWVQTTSASLKFTSGTYAVTETKAPTGYKAAAPQKFTVSDNGSVLVKGKTQQDRTVTLVNRRASGRHAAQHKAGTSAKAVKSGKTKAGKTTAVKRAAAEGENDAESADVNGSEGGDGTGTVKGEKEQTPVVSDAAVQPLAVNSLTNINAATDKSSYITSISVDKTDVTTPEQIKVTASFSDGGGNEHVFHGGDTITINWRKSKDAYIQGYRKNIPLVSDDGVTYASAEISSDQAVITFNSNVDTMYDVSGHIWFTAVAVNHAEGDAENKSSVTIQGGSKAQTVSIIKPETGSGSGEQSNTPFFRKQAAELGGVWQNVNGKWVMGLDPNNPTYTKWNLTANETHETGMQSPIIIRDTLGAGQEIDHNGDAQIYSEREYTDRDNITLSGSLDSVVKQWNDKYRSGESSLQINNGNIVWTIQPDIANGVGWHLKYSCMITDYSLPLLQNEADLTYTDQNGERKTMHDASYFAGVNAGGDITALPRGVLQITKKIQGTEQTVPGVTFTVEKQDGQSWTLVGSMTTNSDGKATMSNLKAGEYRVYESSHPDFLNDVFTVETESYSKERPYIFTVGENDKNGIAVSAEDSIKTRVITANKVWKGESDNNSHHPDVSFQLYRKTEKTSRYTAVSKPKTLKNGDPSVIWNNMPEYTVTGKPYTYYVKEVRVPEGYTSNDDYVKVVNGTATITNTYTKPSQDTGSLKLTKTSSGHDTPDDAEFTITGPNRYKNTVTYKQFKDGVYTLENLPVGEYQVQEDADSAKIDGYTLEVKGNNGKVKVKDKETTTVAITNTYTPNTPNIPVTPSTPKTFVKVTKNWVGGQESSAVVHLLADGKVVATETLNAQNGWTHTFTNLDKQVAGNDVVYTVSEDQTAGYTTKITGDAANGFVITNTKDQPDKPVKPDKPDTPDTPTPSKPENHSGNNTPSHSKNTGNHSGQNTPVNPSSSTVDNHQTVKPMIPAAAKTAASGNHAAASANIPKTGDETDLSLYAFLLGGAAALLAVILVLKSRREN